MTPTNQVTQMLAALLLTRTERMMWWGIYQRLIQLEGDSLSQADVLQRSEQMFYDALVRVGRAQENSGSDKVIVPQQLQVDVL